MSEGIKQIKKHEGYRRFVYKDTEGILTCGIGRNLESKGISEDEAEMMLKNDVKEFIAKVDSKYKWVDVMGEPRQWVIYNMAFNMGMGGIAKHKNFLKECESHNYKAASIEMLNSKWARQVKGRAHELSRQMETGEWQ